jgi:hypothetical protein
MPQPQQLPMALGSTLSPHIDDHTKLSNTADRHANKHNKNVTTAAAAWSVLAEAAVLVLAVLLRLH